jgi:hypothetical protein
VGHALRYLANCSIMFTELEYRPTVSTPDSLGWLPRARRAGQPGPHTFRLARPG